MDSHPSLIKLMMPYFRKKLPTNDIPWHKVVCDADKVRILIDYARTDLFLPGIQYTEFIKDYDGLAMVFITEADPEMYYGIMDTVTMVAFENPKAAVRWKLSQ